MAWSPYKDQIIGYVERNPGCCKWDVAAYCTHNKRRCPSKQYYLLNTALRHGWIYGVYEGGRWHLFATEELLSEWQELDLGYHISTKGGAALT